MLKPGGASGEGDEALEFYAKHTAQIEVTTHKPCHIVAFNTRKLNVCICAKYTSHGPTEAEVFAPRW